MHDAGQPGDHVRADVAAVVGPDDLLVEDPVLHHDRVDGLLLEPPDVGAEEAVVAAHRGEDRGLARCDGLGEVVARPVGRVALADAVLREGDRVDLAVVHDVAVLREDALGRDRSGAQVDLQGARRRREHPCDRHRRARVGDAADSERARADGRVLGRGSGNRGGAGGLDAQRRHDEHRGDQDQRSGGATSDPRALLRPGVPRSSDGWPAEDPHGRPPCSRLLLEPIDLGLVRISLQGPAATSVGS